MSDHKHHHHHHKNYEVTNPFYEIQKKANKLQHDVQEKAEELQHDVHDKAAKIHYHALQKEIQLQEQVQKQVEILTRRETIKYIVACILFGSMIFSTRHISIGPLQTTFLRVMVGTFFLIIVFACSKFRATLWDYSKSQLLFLIASGICIGVNWLIISDATSKLGVTTVTLTYSLGPGLLLVVSPFLFKEAKLTPSKIVGFVICSFGVLLLDYQFIVEPHSFDVLTDVLVATCFTVVIVYCNRKLENINGLENAMFQMIIAFILIFIIYVWRHGLYFEVPDPDSWWVLGAGIVHTGLPVYLYLSSIDDLRADIIAFAGYIRPLTTILISVLVFGDHMSLEAYIGAAFILGGVAVANFFRRKKLTKTRTF